MSSHPSFPEILRTIDREYRRRTGATLGAGSGDAAVKGDEARLAWIHAEAPFGLLAHGTGEDPRFIYANAAALRAFGYTLDEFLRLPSRLSVGPDATTDRSRLLAEVQRNGIVRGYAGVRVAKGGKPFRIRDGVVWELTGTNGRRLGQAALVWPEP